MLQAKNVSFGYHRRRKEVLSDFSLSLKTGKVYGLLGKNGVGKSTLLYLMSGLLTPKRGRVMYRGTDVRRRLPATLQDMFLVPEEFDLPSVSLVSYIELNSRFYPRFSKEDMVRYLHLFEMDMDAHLGALSMGQKKKVFMSFALATNTSLLLMDEPTNGLDIPGKAAFRRFIASSASDDRIIVISTHQVRDIDRILDHVIIMNNRSLLLNETINAITDRLAFLNTSDRELIDRALVAQPGIGNAQIIVPNDGSYDTEVNLETLFELATTRRDVIDSLFNTQRKQ